VVSNIFVYYVISGYRCVWTLLEARCKVTTQQMVTNGKKHKAIFCKGKEVIYNVNRLYKKQEMDKNLRLSLILIWTKRTFLKNVFNVPVISYSHSLI